MVETQYHPEITAHKGSDTQTSTEPTSFWHDAYEHPVRSTLEAGAAVAGVALLGTGAFKITQDFLKPSALLIEDTPFMGKALQYVLKDQGFKVTWLTGVAKAKPFTGIAEGGRQFVVDLPKFKTALVDGELENSPLQGEDVVKALAGKMPIIGTSSVDSINQAMIANGADAAANKGVLFTALANDQLNLVRASEDLSGLQPALDRLTVSMKAPEAKPLRKAADNLLQRFM